MSSHWQRPSFRTGTGAAKLVQPLEQQAPRTYTGQAPKQPLGDMGGTYIDVGMQGQATPLEQRRRLAGLGDSPSLDGLVTTEITNAVTGKWLPGLPEGAPRVMTQAPTSTTGAYFLVAYWLAIGARIKQSRTMAAYASAAYAKARATTPSVAVGDIVSVLQDGVATAKSFGSGKVAAVIQRTASPSAVRSAQQSAAASSAAVRSAAPSTPTAAEIAWNVAVPGAWVVEQTGAGEWARNQAAASQNRVVDAGTSLIDRAQNTAQGLADRARQGLSTIDPRNLIPDASDAPLWLKVLAWAPLAFVGLGALGLLAWAAKAASKKRRAPVPARVGNPSRRRSASRSRRRR